MNLRTQPEGSISQDRVSDQDRSSDQGRSVAIKDAQLSLDAVRQQVARVFVGNKESIDILLIALLARGHVLVEGVPGVAKTTLAKTFAKTLGCDMSRIQFTPDLLPADITGTYVLDPRQASFSLRKGPIFANIVLADEINRAPAKTQSALLEAMQEGQSTIEGVIQKLPFPFMVMATQNPVDFEGTYPLPEAQLDRFLVRLTLGYPSETAEVAMLRTHHLEPPQPSTVLSPDQVLELQDLTRQVFVEDDVEHYIVRLCRATRSHPRVVLGASPRSSLGLLQASKAKALLEGRDFTTPDDVRAIAAVVLSHRLILTPELEGDEAARSAIVRDLLNQVPVERKPSADR
ncbi:MAG TPA: MoxR family ATPase [Polyangiaceae bacterium]|nr:MoxR family ATPase [Polyangiaceae bacterium]